jgi:DNA primase
MATDTVQRIKDKLSIVDVVSQYVKLERAGQSMRARCPFHAERTPSFHVSPERGTYHCFGCNVGGDIFTFVQEIEGLDFKGALKIMAEKAGVEVVYAKKGDRDERERLFELLEAATIFYVGQMTDEAKKYLKERGITDETSKEFRIGWASDAWEAASDYLRKKKFSDREIIDAGLAVKGEKGLRDKFRNRIMFPIADSAGRIVGFSGRIFGEKASPEAPKYLNSPETPLFHKSRILYGFDRAKVAIRKHNFAILVEGQMDLILSHQAGWPNTVAVSGTAFTQEHARLLKRMSDNLVLALDADQAGIKAAGKAARAALQGGLNVKVAKLPSSLDPADLILKHGPDAWRAAIRDSKDIVTFLLDVLAEHLPQADKLRRAVETIVLPYLSDVQSPIEREHYLKEISRRLGVSEAAVREAFEKTPKVSGDATPRKAAELQKQDESNKADRVRQAYALLLWQRSLQKPSLDVATYERELAGIIGKESMEILVSLPEAERESMRFSAERLHGKGTGVEREARALLSVLRREQLTARLAAAAAALKTAEGEGNEEEVERLMRECKLLTGEIAKFHAGV